ncbi:MAG: hypothetical protein IGS39_22235, partial [Calothrix sp. C42_A2020_038]|nr:hypothetical protein [Calothrix sp. C42_A2020_038]
MTFAQESYVVAIASTPNLRKFNFHNRKLVFLGGFCTLRQMRIFIMSRLISTLILRCGAGAIIALTISPLLAETATAALRQLDTSEIAATESGVLYAQIKGTKGGTTPPPKGTEPPPPKGTEPPP